MKIYLSGNMTPSAEYYDMWTSTMTYDLEDVNIRTSISELKDPSDGKFIVYHDLARLKRCDMLVANLSVTDHNYHLTGAIVEIYEAYKQNKAVYTFFDDAALASEQALSPWIQQFVTRHFDTYEDLIDYLRLEENV